MILINAIAPVFFGDHNSKVSLDDGRGFSAMTLFKLLDTSRYDATNFLNHAIIKWASTGCNWCVTISIIYT
jgi:hypothetical protein